MKRQGGFTIVELLIVIVVIAILAAISIVSYTGIQDRSTYSARLSDLTSIKKAVEAYRAANDQYPVTGTTAAPGWRYSCQYPDPADFIPDIKSVVSSLPKAPCTSANLTNDTWIYGSDGAGYKLIWVRPVMSDGVRSRIPTNMRDTLGPNRWGSSSAWGFWEGTTWAYL